MAENLTVKLLESIMLKGKAGFTNDNKTRGLYFKISETGGASWAFRYRDRRTGDGRWMGLGGYPAVSLAQARKLALQAQSDLANLEDPIDKRSEQRRIERAAKLKQKTVKEFFEEWMDKQTDSFRETKNGKEYSSQFNKYVYPVIGSLPVATLTVEDVVKVLEPIWQTKHDAALKLRGRIYRVIESAIVLEVRTNPKNPAQKSFVEVAIGTTTKDVRKAKPVQHKRPLALDLVQKFWASIGEHGGLTANAMKFKFLCATRNHEATHTQWSEIDFKNRVWTVAEERMGKNDSEHRIPLSDQALEIIEAQKGLDEVYLFPGQKAGQPINRESPQWLLKKSGWYEHCDAHGLRGTFKNWSIANGYQHIVSEWALAHYNEMTKTELAYIDENEKALFDVRREMMQAWAEFVCVA